MFPFGAERILGFRVETSAIANSTVENTNASDLAILDLVGIAKTSYRRRVGVAWSLGRLLVVMGIDGVEVLDVTDKVALLVSLDSLAIHRVKSRCFLRFIAHP